VDDSAEMLNPIQVQTNKAIAFNKLLTIPEEDDPMEKTSSQSNVAHNDKLLDHQDIEEVLLYKEEYTKLLDQTNKNEQMDDNTNKSEDDHFDP